MTASALWKRTTQFNALEVVLRDLIERTLSEHLGQDWIEQCGTPERLERWRDRKTEEAKRRDGTVLKERLLYNSDFTDLSVIIKNWPLFTDCLRDQRTFLVYREQLEEFRNAEMHSRALLPFEKALVEGMTCERRNKVTLFRATDDSLDRHFPRIEQVRDSFGNVATAPEPYPSITVATELVLHPGDELTFECSAWDPDNRAPERALSVLFGKVESSSKGLNARFVWRVTDEHIGGTVYVEITMTGDRPYHRFSHHDGGVSFLYRVLPRS